MVIEMAYSTDYRLCADMSALPRKSHPPRKIVLEELINLVEKEPDWTLAEYAAHFGCSAQAVAKRLKQQKITRKKNISLPRKR